MKQKEQYDVTGMSDKEIVDIVKKIFRTHPGNGGNHVINAKANRGVLDFIMRYTSHFDSNEEYSFVNLTTRCYVIVNDLAEEDFPRCETCGEIIKANAVSMKKGFPYKTCSRRCAALNPKRKKKIEETNAKLGRHLHWSNWEKAKQTQKDKPEEVKALEKEKRKATVQKHVDEDPDYWAKREQKTKATKVANGHDANWNNHDQASATKQMKAEEDPAYWKKIQEKQQQTNVDNGHDKNWHNAEKGAETLQKHAEEDKMLWMSIENKRKSTKAANGHDKNWNNTEKAAQTCLERYGSTCYLTSYEGKKKIAATNVERYGVANPLQSEEIHDKCISTKYQNIFDMIMSDNDEVEPLFTYEEFKSKTKTTIFKWRCKKCGTVFDSPVNFPYARGEANGVTGTYARCLNCYPLESGSHQQMEVKKFIASLIDESKIIYNDRKAIAPKEIDILIPSLKIGFEYDGLYWHSALAGTHPSAAKQKTDMCNSAGIRLFRIYEDDWTSKCDIVKSDIKKVLNHCDRTVSPNECYAQRCSYDVAREFHERNSLKHLNKSSSINVCLKCYRTDEIVAMMSGNVHDDVLVMSNCSTMLNTYVDPKAFGMILDMLHDDYVSKNIKIIRSKITQDWNDSSFLTHNGFRLSKTTDFNSIIIDTVNWKRLGMNVSKYKLDECFGISVDETKTLVENLHSNQMSMIYDAGNAIYELETSKMRNAQEQIAS